MKSLYSEEWFNKLFAVICILVVIVGFSIQNLLVLMLPFIFIGAFYFFKIEKNSDASLLQKLGILMAVLPFLLAFVFIACGNVKNAWFNAYTQDQWVRIFTGILIYAGTITLAVSTFWMKSHNPANKNNNKIKEEAEQLSFVSLYPKKSEKIENLPLSGSLEHYRQFVIPTNTKTDWIKIPCHLKNESQYPVVSIGLEALNEEIKGTKSINYGLLIPPFQTIGIDLFVPLTHAKSIEIKCSFLNVLNRKTNGLLHLVSQESEYRGVYNLRIIE